MSKKKGSLFGPAKNKYLAEIVSLENSNKALNSSILLMKEFKNAKTDRKRSRILHATDLAMKRAEVGSTNMRNSTKERDEFKVIAKIYKQTYNILKDY